MSSNSNGRTGVQTANHAAGLIGILQLAGAHPSGLVGTLGQNNRTVWFQDNIEAIFQSVGPLGMYNPISLLVLLLCFALASNQAREVYDQHHSNNQTGATHKDVPPCIQNFFVCLKPSRMCLLFLPRQWRPGMKGAVLCLG
jgi:hypothetical protein